VQPRRDVLILALRACEGDEVAFAALCREMESILHGIAWEYYAPGLDHDDLMQEARIALHAATVSFDPAAGPPFEAFAAIVVRRRVGTAVKLANAGKHRPLWEHRLEEPVSEDADRTFGDALPASRLFDTAVIVESRDDLARLVGALSQSLTALEATVLARILSGASLTEAGEGLGGGTKVADNALQRVRRKAVAALGAG
jgi:RNA polymerase sigma-H factor